jgi:hypothetical protein
VVFQLVILEYRNRASLRLGIAVSRITLDRGDRALNHRRRRRRERRL